MSQPGGPHDAGRSDASGSASVHGTSSTGDGKSATQKAAETARHEADRFREMAKERARSMAEEQKTAAAEQVHGFADALHKTSQDLREQNYGTLGEYADTAARRLDDFAQRLREREVTALMGDVERFARQQPALFLGGAVALGFALSRFMIASGERYSRAEGYRYAEDFEREYGGDRASASSTRPIPSTVASGSGATMSTATPTGGASGAAAGGTGPSVSTSSGLTAGGTGTRSTTGGSHGA